MLHAQTEIYGRKKKVVKHTKNKNIRPLYRVPQEKRSLFWEVTVSVILSKKMCMHIYPVPNSINYTSDYFFNVFQISEQK
jgi:hypothetical protein